MSRTERARLLAELLADLAARLAPADPRAAIADALDELQRQLYGEPPDEMDFTYEPEAARHFT